LPPTTAALEEHDRFCRHHQFAAAVADANRALITHGRVDPSYLIVDRNRRAHVVGPVTAKLCVLAI
jgi:hypothetical protein